METTLFNDDLLLNLKNDDLEKILNKCIFIIDDLGLKPISEYKDVLSIKTKIKNKLENIILILGEIYRRNFNFVDVIHYLKNINKFLEDTCYFCSEKKIDYHIWGDNILPSSLWSICSSCNSKYLNVTQSQTLSIIINDVHYSRLISRPMYSEDLKQRQVSLYKDLIQLNIGLKTTLRNKIMEIKLVKDNMFKILKAPRLTKELEKCMDEILDLNGNKISQMKDYLTEEQYRFVRSGNKFENLSNQEDMLLSMNKMLEELKRFSFGDVIYPIHHLVNELNTSKMRQKDHEKQLEKLLNI